MLRCLGAALLVGVASMPGSAFACPDCATARVVWASIMDERFWPHLLAIVAPLVVLGAIVALLYRVGSAHASCAPKTPKETER